MEKVQTCVDGNGNRYVQFKSGEFVSRLNSAYQIALSSRLLAGEAPDYSAAANDKAELVFEMPKYDKQHTPIDDFVVTPDGQLYIYAIRALFRVVKLEVNELVMDQV